MSLRNRLRAVPFAGASQTAVVFGALVLYVVTAAPCVLGGDNGEFATLTAVGGVAHPPGYPLYVLYLRATRFLAHDSPAHASALATALLGGASVAMLQLAARRWGASRFAAALASALYAFSPLTWAQATQAEAFTLNALLAFAIVALAAPEAPGMRAIRGERRVVALGALAGLGLSNHHSIALLAPLGLYASIEAVREARSRWRAVALGVLALAAGLLPYAYLLAAAQPAARVDAWSWGQISDVQALVRQFLRSDYGTTELGLGAGAREPAAQIALLARSLFFGNFGLPALLLIGGGVAIVQGARPRGHGAHLALLASFLLAGPVFVSWFNVPPRGLGVSIVERFHLLPSALLAVLAAPAIDRALPMLRARAPLGLVVTALASCTAILFAAPAVREQHRPDVERYVLDALRLAPERAILVGSGDHRFGAFLYARYALRERTDVVFINPRLLLGSWYPPRVSAQLGLAIVHGEARPERPGYPELDAAVLTRQLVRTGRPVFFTDWFAAGLDRLPSFPVGPLVRIAPDPRMVPPPATLLSMNIEAAALLRGPSEPPASPHSWAGDLANDYARPWIVLTQALRASGDSAQADRCAARAHALAPWLDAP